MACNVTNDLLEILASSEEISILTVPYELGSEKGGVFSKSINAIPNSSVVNVLLTNCPDSFDKVSIKLIPSNGWPVSSAFTEIFP